jgi:hypothetical protein
LNKQSRGKKSNKVDPVLQMAKRNRDASLARMLAEKNDKTIQKNRHDDEQSAKKELHAELETQRLFREMKRREF